MSQHVETMRAALHEIGERDLAAGVVDVMEPGGRYGSYDLRNHRSKMMIMRASLVASIALDGASFPVHCSRHAVNWLAGGPRPPEWDQCAKVAAWQMLNDPTTVCANTPRPI